MNGLHTYRLTVRSKRDGQSALILCTDSPLPGYLWSSALDHVKLMQSMEDRDYRPRTRAWVGLPDQCTMGFSPKWDEIRSQVLGMDWLGTGDFTVPALGYELDYHIEML